ncbi:hypothetical protein BX33_24895 [Escherichia coli O157:H7 str. 2009EL1449]|nr:hypothetical protein BX33_24895 [Escherichia coli O157:H7 str. 2009EL1449]
MSVVVSGTLKSPDGEAISGANITLTALTVSPDALSGTSASAVTREGGYYGMTMDPGEYAVSVTVKGKTLSASGETVSAVRVIFAPDIASPSGDFSVPETTTLTLHLR